MHPGALAAKRAIDIMAGLIGLLVSTPILLAAALAIWLDDGRPVLLRQLRLGWHGEPFRMWKFRTMWRGAADLRHADGSTVTIRHDPRFTRLGTALRALSIDELPQLVNVICGDMSLVGPRPDLTDQLGYYRPGDRERLSMRPGLTGLAQVKGRNALSVRDRRRWDRIYVRRWSLWLDAAILLSTVRVVLRAQHVTSDTGRAR